jgi:hypothetical protein
VAFLTPLRLTGYPPNPVREGLPTNKDWAEPSTEVPCRDRDEARCETRPAANQLAEFCRQSILALQRRQEFDLLLNFGDRDGSKVGLTQLLVELRQFRLLESGPLCDAGFDLLA